jgi:Ca-activated chloride channel family protein
MKTAHRFHRLGGPVMIGLFSLSPLARGEFATPSGPYASSQIEVQSRPASSLFKGEQANQKTEIHFDPDSGTVTMKMLVQDAHGYFVPNIRPENFVVYEDGARQEAAVGIEHAPVSLAVLMEWGGRSRALQWSLGLEAPQAARELLNHLGRDDQLGIWRYGDRLEPVVDFPTSLDAVDRRLPGPGAPGFSETNLYDALVATIHELDHAAHRKALILISSGIDTFSQTRYEDLLRVVRDSGVPLYILDAGSALRRSAEHGLRAGPYARIDWQRARAQLREIAAASGGRWYPIESFIGLAGIYDDIMENLRVRYVITYKSSSQDNLQATRSVRIELVNPGTGGPLEVIDTAGKPVHLNIVAESQYVPRGTAAGEDKES